jgi:glycosyltransferase involved in cell wall biosynthesis
MHLIMLILFWAFFAIVTWVYFGYPLALACGLCGKPIAPLAVPESSLPNISVIVPAHNEEVAIEAKQRNLLDLDYPPECVEILVGSDGSSDRTQEIAEGFCDQGVTLISFPQQRGKSAIQNGLAAVSSGSILVFTDADCFVARDAVRRLVRLFNDPRVGLVTAAPRYASSGESGVAANESLYLRYETWLRRMESQRGLLAMASGSLFAIRRSLWQPLDPDLGDDFALPLLVARVRARNVLETGARPITDITQSTPRAMFRLKVRVVSKDLRALLRYCALLNHFQYGFVAVGLWSHKLLRWLVPYLLLGIFATNLFLLDRAFFRAAFVLQSTFYLLAAAKPVVLNKSRAHLWSLPMSFCVVNCASALGILKCLAGRSSGVWQPERSTSAPLNRNAGASQATE